MGIYDREYYRDESAGSGWFSGVAPACKAFVVLTIACYVAQLLVGPEFSDLLDAQPDKIFGGFQVWRLLTATFLHDVNSPLSIVFNLLFLWFAGRELESMYGTRDFRVMYLVAAAVTTLAFALVQRYGPPGWVSGEFILGAAGPVTTVMVLYALYYPRREVLLFFILPVEIWLLLVIYLGLQAFLLLGGRVGGDVAAANLTGAAFGYAFKALDLRWSRLSQAIKRSRRPKFRVISPEPREREKPAVRAAAPTWSPEPASTARPAPTAVLPEEQLDAQLDEVLAKIAREGRGALTDDDHRVLQEASTRARNRRSERL